MSFNRTESFNLESALHHTNPSINGLNDQFMGSILDFLDDNDFINFFATEKKFFIQKLFIEEIIKRYEQYYAVHITDNIEHGAENTFIILKNGQALVKKNYMYQQLFPYMPQGFSALPASLSAHRIKYISGKCDILTESGDVIFLSFVQCGSFKEVNHSVYLKHYYPKCHIVQMLEYNYRTYLLDADGTVYQPSLRNINGNIVIQLKEMQTTTNNDLKEYTITKLVRTEYGLLLLTHEGRVIFSERNNNLDNLSPALLTGAMIEEKIIDMCYVRSIHLFLTETGKVFCSGQNLHDLFMGALSEGIPETSDQPVLVEALSPYVIKEIKPSQGLTAKALYFKTNQGDSYLIGSHFQNDPIERIQLPSLDEFAIDENNRSEEPDDTPSEPSEHSHLELNEESDQEIENAPEIQISILDAKIYSNCIWYLTNAGDLYIRTEESWQRFNFPDRALKLACKNIGNRGEHFNFHVLTESGEVYSDKPHSNGSELEAINVKHLLTYTNKPYHCLNKMVKALGQHGLFIRTVEYTPDVTYEDENQSDVDSCSTPTTPKLNMN